MSINDKTLLNISNNLHTIIVRDYEGHIVKMEGNQLDRTNLVISSNGTVYDKNSNKWYLHTVSTDGQLITEVFTDVTSLQLEVLRLKEQNNIYQTEIENYQYDHLTRVYTRKAILEKLKETIMNPTRPGFCIVMCDLDHLKKINDLHGHNTGDEVLKAMGRTLLNNSNQTSISVGRLAGDEFLILYNSNEINTVSQMVDKIRGEISMLLFATKDIQFTISASFGVYHFSNPQMFSTNPQTMETTIQSILEYIDKAMYESKEKGRNTTSIHTIG